MAQKSTARNGRSISEYILSRSRAAAVKLYQRATYKEEMVVPDRMLLSAKMADAAQSLGKALLTSLNIDNSTVTPSSTSQPLSEVLPSGSHGSICFVVRRPG